MIPPAFKTVLAEAPATVANVGPGFDCFGLALSSPADRVRVTLSDEPGVRIDTIRGDGGQLPRTLLQNTAGLVVHKFVERFQIKRGLSLEIEKGLPLRSGLGSSAASSVAALLAVNTLFGSPMSHVEMLPLLKECEAMACGAAHTDNVAPCLFGGFVAVRNSREYPVIHIPIPKDLYCVVFHPHVELSTRDARSVLPHKVPITTVSEQGSNMVGLVMGLLQENEDLISDCVRDLIAEPCRQTLIPGFLQVRSAVLQAGALGHGISGSGPSVFALCRGLKVVEAVVEAGSALFCQLEVGVDCHHSLIEGTGARILEEGP